jgi:hypothetical protein
MVCEEEEDYIIPPTSRWIDDTRYLKQSAGDKKYATGLKGVLIRINPIFLMGYSRSFRPPGTCHILM